jgi:type I restriction enzyme S subunit
LTDIPLLPGWATTKLSDILLAIIGGGTPSRKVPDYFTGTIPWFTVKDMKSLHPRDAKEHISEVAVRDSATNVISPNTLIVATRIALGKAIKPTVACAINQDLKALIVEHSIDSDFLLYWIISNAKVIQDLGSGTTVSGIRLETLNALCLNLPPSAEQTRIVEKIEELFSDLDAGVAELKAAQKKLAQYRQSLLYLVP